MLHKIKLSKRALITLAIFALMFLAIFIRITFIKMQTEKQVASFYETYKTQGFPVSTTILKKEKVSFFLEITLIKDSNTKYKAWVDSTKKRKLKRNQTVVFKSNGITYKGKITFISNSIDYNYGLYQVNVSFTKALPNKQNWVNAEVIYYSANTYATKSENIACQNNVCSLWYVKDNKAYKQNIKIGKKDNYKTELISKIDNNLMIITSDRKQLHDGIKVFVAEGDE